MAEEAKISGLPIAISITGDEISEIVQDGQNKQVSKSVERTYMQSGLTKSSVGLGNVDNTSDLDKPVSTAQQAAIDQAETDANAYTDDAIAQEVIDRNAAIQAAVTGLWEAAIYSETKVFVLYSLDGYIELFKLVSNVRPYNSTNFENEYAAGDWELVSEKQYFIVTKTSHGFPVNSVLTIREGAWNLFTTGDQKLAIVKKVIDANRVLLASVGARLKGFTGLTFGAIYYAQADGSISTVETNEPLMVAISTSESVLLSSSTVADSHFRGKYASLVALEAAIPTGNDGDYATVDAGAGSYAIEYIWDADEGWIESSGGDVDQQALFPDTYFVSPLGDDLTAEVGNLSKPFTPTGAVALAVAGDTITFLPGEYTINSNMAIDGVSYTTFGGKVKITVNGNSVTLFNYGSSSSTLPIIIDGNFEFELNGTSSVIFNFNDVSPNYRAHVIKFSLLNCISGSYAVILPRLARNSVFDGNINIHSDYTVYAIRGPLSGNKATGAGSTIRFNIYNESNIEAFIPATSGYNLFMTYYGTQKGLSPGSAPSGAQDNNSTLNITQPSGATSCLYGGNHDVSLVGGTLTIMNNEKVNLKGQLRDCTLRVNPGVRLKTYLRADTVVIYNDQANRLELDGVYISCSHTHAGSPKTVLNGYYESFSVANVCSMAINGYVSLLANQYLQVPSTSTLEINGTLVGNRAAGIVYLYQNNSKAVVSGNIKNIADGPCIYTATSITPIVILKNATLESGASATDSINIVTAANFKMYGASYSNKALGGTAPTYLVGSGSDYIVDSDVEVANI